FTNFNEDRYQGGDGMEVDGSMNLLPNKMIAQEIYMELKEFAQSGEIGNNDIPQISTIQIGLEDIQENLIMQGQSLHLKPSTLVELLLQTQY
ncbi:2786_t:CDS:2, partial [Gigaspora margarita]